MTVGVSIMKKIIALAWTTYLRSLSVFPIFKRCLSRIPFFFILIAMGLTYPGTIQAKSPTDLNVKTNKPNKIKPTSTTTPGSAAAVKPKLVDLKITEFTVTATSPQIQQGGTLSSSTIVKNFGIKRSGQYMVQYYITKNPKRIRPDQNIGGSPGVGLGKNATKPFNRSLHIPEDLDPGFYFVVARVEQSGKNKVKDYKAKRINVRSSSAPASAPTRGTMSTSTDGPRIRTITPSQVITGQSITISGDRFGPGQGQVELGFANPDALVPLPVTQWSNQRIVARVPDSTDALVPAGNSAVTLWVKPDGFEEHGLRGGKTIRLVSGLVPMIQTLSSRTIMPNQTITLYGDNFLDEQPGGVKFIFHGHEFEGSIEPDGWRNNQIQVELPKDITGITSTDGRVEVENHRGRKSHHSIVFLPNLEKKVFRDSVRHRYRHSKSIGAEFAYKTIKIMIFKNIAYLQKIFLKNDWVITRAEIEKHDGNGTCTFDPPVALGEKQIPNFIKVHHNETYDTISCTCEIEIQGPAGTNPF